MVRPPRVGGRFVATERLAGDGPERTYLAFDDAVGGWTALKVLGAAASPEAAARFRRSISALAGSKHPHVVQVVAHDLEAATPWAALELPGGGTPADYLQSFGPMHPALALQVVRQAAEAAAALHARRALPLALGPADLRFDRAGGCKVDLGRACFDPTAADARFAVVSLGTTLLALLTDTAPGSLGAIAEDDPRLQGLGRELVQALLHARTLPDPASLVRRLGELEVPPPPRATPGLGGSVRELPDQPPLWLPSLGAVGLEELAGFPVAEPAPEPEPTPAEPTPPPAERIRASQMSVPRPSERSRGPTRLPRASTMVGLTAGLVAIGVVMGAATWGVAGYGARGVHRAEHQAVEARARLVTLATHHAPAVTELVRLGADGAPLLAALEGFDESPTDDRYDAALTLLDAIDGAWADVDAQRASAMTASAVQELRAARSAASTSEERWRAACTSGPGRLAVGLGFAQGPAPPLPPP